MRAISKHDAIFIVLLIVFGIQLSKMLDSWMMYGQMKLLERVNREEG